MGFTDTYLKLHSPPEFMFGDSLTNDYRSKVSVLLLVLSLGFVVLAQFLIPTPNHEFRRVLVCGLELLFVLPYLGMLPDRTNFVVVRPAAAILLTLWVASSVAAVVLSNHWAAALVRQAEWFCHLLFAASVWHFVTSSRDAARWVIGLALIAALSAVVLVVRSWFIMPGAAEHDWRTSLPVFSDIEQFGHVVLVGLVLAHVGVADRESRAVGIMISVMLLSVFWGAIIWAGTGIAFLCAVFAVALIAILTPPAGRGRLAGATFVSMSSGLLLSVGLPVRHAGMGLSGLLQDLSIGPEGMLKGVPAAWGASWQQFLAQPWYGHGSDAYRYLPSRPFGIHPQNMVLQFMTDWGVAGAVAFSMLLLGALVAAWLVLREVRSDLRAERVVAFTAIVVLSVYGLVGGTYYHAIPLLMLATCFAIALVPPVYASAARGPRGGVISLRIGLVRSIAVVATALFFVQAALLIVLSQSEVPVPDSGRAQFVRYFPSSTYNLDRWLASWEDTYPEAAEEWVHWAHDHSSDAYFFRGREAAMLAERGDYEEARDHAVQALRSAPRAQQLKFAAAMEPLIELGDAYSGQMLFGLDADSSAVGVDSTGYGSVDNPDPGR